MLRSFLVVIDMLNDFLDAEGKLFCGEASRAIIPAVAQLVESFLRHEQPVYYVCDDHAPDDLEFKIYPPHAVHGTWGAQIIPELTPSDKAHILPKKRFSALFQTTLPQILQEQEPEAVWLAGVVTSICVMDTAGDLRNRDHNVVIPVDAVADFDPVYHRFALERMHRVYGATLLASKDFPSAMTSTGSNPS